MRGLHPSPAAGIVPAMKLSPGKDDSLSFPRTEAASSAELRENFRTLNDVLDELYFTISFRCGDGVFAAGGGVAPTASAVIGGTATVLFPPTAGGQPTWRIMEPRRARWQAAGIRTTVWYTSDVGSTNNFVFMWRVVGSDGGDATFGAADYVSAPNLLPGPAVANTKMVATFVDNSANVIPGNRPVMHFRYTRDKVNAADTNANALHVYLVKVEVIPL